MDDQTSPIVDAEVVEEQTTTESDINTASSEPQTANRAMILMDLENLIRSHLASIDKMQVESKKHKEMLDSVFDNDETYKKHSDAAKEANKIKSATKAQIMKQPAVAELAEKVKHMRTDVKELKDALSDYLQQYQQMSGLTQIEDDQGEMREIVYDARLVKRFEGQPKGR